MKSFVHDSWKVEVNRGSILTSEEFDKTCVELDIPQIPEMTFGNNILEISHKSGFSILFSSIDALKLVNNKQDLIKVAIADEWKESRLENENIQNVSKPFDWTFTTNYKGTINDTNNQVFISKSDEKIDVERLKRREKILFFDEIVLFEDELADNGSAQLTVKLRVMPTCMFVLMRFFLRVDGVVCRIYDTRLYHQFGSTFLIREYTEKEAPYDELKPVFASDLINPMIVDKKLKVKCYINEKIEFEKALQPICEK